MGQHDMEDGDSQRLTTGSLVILAIIAIAAAASVLKPVLIPFVLAVFVSYLVSPLVDPLQIRWGLPRGVALVLAIVIIAGGMTVFLWLLTESLTAVVDKADEYRDHVVIIYQDAVIWLRETLGIEIAASEGTGGLAEKLKSLPVESMAFDALGSVAAILSDAALVLLFSIYLLVGRSPKPITEGIWAEIDQSVRKYLVVKVYTSAANAAIFGTILLIFGVDLAFVFAILSFMLNFIPNVGSLIAILLPLPVVIVSSMTGVEVGMMMLLLVVNQNVIGNVIEPKLMGEGLDLHPVTVLLGLALWGMIWGIAGMLMSAPLMAVLRIILRRYEITRPAAHLLAGRLGSDAIAEYEEANPVD
jgi:AI-2 transport protein TqsA